MSISHHTLMFDIIVKLLDWGEDGMNTGAQNAALRASFRQEVAVWHKLDHPNVTKVKLISSMSYVQFIDIYVIN